MADEQKFPSVSCAGLDRRGTTWGLLGVAVLLALTFVGSHGPVWFDAALVGYLFGMIFWGCILAALFTFPLTMGLIHLGSTALPRSGCEPPLTSTCSKSSRGSHSAGVFVAWSASAFGSVHRGVTVGLARRVMNHEQA